MLHDAQMQVAGDANVKRACMAAENVDVAAGHSKMLAVLVVGPSERRFCGELEMQKTASSRISIVCQTVSPYGTRSWAKFSKFSRPYGARFRQGRSDADSLARRSYCGMASAF
jgi:hypothetical protein